MDNDTHAFIVRVWHENLGQEGKLACWRGMIEHVGSQKRLYFYNFDHITNFIQEEVGVNGAVLRRKGWLGRIRDEIKGLAGRNS